MTAGSTRRRGQGIRCASFVAAERVWDHAARQARDLRRDGRPDDASRWLCLQSRAAEGCSGLRAAYNPIRLRTLPGEAGVSPDFVDTVTEDGHQGQAQQISISLSTLSAARSCKPAVC